MECIKTDIEGVVFFEPTIHRDSRGYFYESFSQREFEQNCGNIIFVQQNQSLSHYGVVRGLHFQAPPFAQAKLVRVVDGCIIDFAVDIRVGSPTYGKHIGVELSSENNRQLFIPQGFAHGFVVLSQSATVQYQCDNYYVPESARTLAWDDTTLNIDWRLDHKDISVSMGDHNAMAFDQFQSPFNELTR